MYIYAYIYILIPKNHGFYLIVDKMGTYKQNPGTCKFYYMIVFLLQDGYVPFLYRFLTSDQAGGGTANVGVSKIPGSCSALSDQTYGEKRFTGEYVYVYI